MILTNMLAKHIEKMLAKILFVEILDISPKSRPPIPENKLTTLYLFSFAQFSRKNLSFQFAP